MNRLVSLFHFFSDNQYSQSLIDEANKLTLSLNTPSSRASCEDTVKKIQNIAKELSSWNQSWLNPQSGQLSQETLRIEFQAKKAAPEYSFRSKVAKDTFERAQTIKDVSVDDQDILSNPEDFYFLTNKEQHLYKQIEAHAANWDTEKVKVRKDQYNKITFHEGTTVESLRNTSNHYVVTYQGPKLVNATNAEGELTIQPIFKRSEKLPYYKNGEKRTFNQGSYYVSLVTSQPSKHLSPVGHHTWLRLTDDEGNVYSVGKWPAKQPVRMAANMDPEFFTPDIHEWIDPYEGIHEEVIEITEDEFHRLKESIETDINAPDTEKNTYNTIVQNCSDWALDTLETCDIIESLDKEERESVKINLFRILLPYRVNFIADDVNGDKKYKPLRVALRVLSIPFEIILRPIATALLLALGATVKRKCDSTCLIRGIKDLFFRQVFRVTHPMYLKKFARDHFPEKSRGLVEPPITQTDQKQTLLVQSF